VGAGADVGAICCGGGAELAICDWPAGGGVLAAWFCVGAGGVGAIWLACELADDGVI
jgi:hypothetical protein